MSRAQEGVLLVDKPAGMTSFRVVERIRGWLRIRKVGHTGTLDPFATGLLVLCLGRATRLAHYITDWDKEYEGGIRLGEETDTDDPTGNVIHAADPSGITPERVAGALERFQGDVQQVPPQYSAKKRNGVPSYRKARRGEAVDLDPVKVRIDRLDVVSVDVPWVHFKARCSKGTYMRSLARDLGRELGCGAHLAWLKRTAVGHLRLENAVALEAVKAATRSAAEPLIWPIERVLGTWNAIALNEVESAKVRYGRDLPVGELHKGHPPALQEGDRLRLLGESGEFLAIGRVVRRSSGLLVHPEKVWMRDA